MSRTRALPNPRMPLLAALAVGAYLTGDAAAQTRIVAPAPAAPARPPSKMAVPAPVPVRVATNKSANQYNHVIEFGKPHRVKLPQGGISLPTGFQILVSETNNSAVDAPATRVLIALNDKKVGVQNLPPFPSPPVRGRAGFWDPVWDWVGPPRLWSMMAPEVSCIRLEPRPDKYDDHGVGGPNMPNNERQYHSGCIVNLKAWMDVPEKIPCTWIGPVCVELLPTTKPTVSVDIEVLDDVSYLPPCARGETTSCLTPGFGWK